MKRNLHWDEYENEYCINYTLILWKKNHIAMLFDRSINQVYYYLFIL